MSPTLSELQDVLDWEAIVVLQTIDEQTGASVEQVVAATDLDRATVTDRVQQLDTLGLVTEVDDEGGTVVEVTGAGHGAIGSGLYDDYDLVAGADIDELAAQVAGLLDRRDELAAELGELRADAREVRTRAESQFGTRDDVTDEFESLLADIEDLEQTLSDDTSE